MSVLFTVQMPVGCLSHHLVVESNTMCHTTHKTQNSSVVKTFHLLFISSNQVPVIRQKLKKIQDCQF